MSGDRLAVDVDALRRSGVDIEGTTQLAKSICGDLRHAVQAHRQAGGTGELGEKFDEGYQPGAERGLAFLKLLGDTIGDTGARTVDTAKNFADCVDEADAQKIV